MKCLRSLYGKQCGPRSDCSYKQCVSLVGDEGWNKRSETFFDIIILHRKIDSFFIYVFWVDFDANENKITYFADPIGHVMLLLKYWECLNNDYVAKYRGEFIKSLRKSNCSIELGATMQ